MLLSNSHQEWSFFYDYLTDFEFYSNQNERINATIKNNYYISSCFFMYCNKSGAVRITGKTNKNIKFLIDTSTFYKCRLYGMPGGSLYINLNKGECIQDRICCFGSLSSQNHGAFCHITVSTISPFRNYLHYSTITWSGDKYFSGIANIQMNNGEINMKSINISYSKMNSDDFYHANCSSKSNVTFCTFVNNKAQATMGFYQADHYALSSSLEFDIQFCNYIENECHHFLFSELQLDIMNCSFNKNIIKTRHFSTVGSGQMHIKGCYFDISDISTYEDKKGSIIITENASEIYPENHHFTNKISFIEQKQSSVPIQFLYQKSGFFQVQKR